MKKLYLNYSDIITAENLFSVWKEFLRGKKNREDVMNFQMYLVDHLSRLSRDLREKTYTHGPYHSFKISDPKPRHIHKATVRDRIVHHLLYRALYPYFDKRFIYNSYSCRIDKGTDKALDRFTAFARRVSKNHTRTCWVLKGDIKKFFANIDHSILKGILRNHIDSEEVLWLLDRVIDSFHTEGRSGIGLPLGNLTSQLLVNIYMNEFDQYMKEDLHAQQYIRYADDFVVLHEDRRYLENSVAPISEFLSARLGLILHPDKLFIQTIASGVDFLGWVHFPDHRVLRTSTKRRMFRTIREKEAKPEMVESYLGLLGHGNTHKIREEVMRIAQESAQGEEAILST